MSDAIVAILIGIAATIITIVIDKLFWEPQRRETLRKQGR